MKKTVLFIIDTLETGGAEKSLLEITSRFKRYNPVFLQLFKGNGLRDEFDERNIEVISMNFPASYRFRRMSKDILPIVKELDPVIVHSTLFRSDLVSRYLNSQRDFLLINSFVNNSYSEKRFSTLSFKDKIKLNLIRKWDQITSKRVDLFISNSHTIKASNSKALKVPLEKISVIFRGRDINCFEEKIDSRRIESLRQEYSLMDKKVFLNVSRLLDRKGQLDLIRAFKKIKEKNSSSRLLIAGEGPYRNVLEKEINDLNLENEVTLLGNRNDIPDLLRMCDFFVFPSHFEGLPGALIEAMISRTPIIASDIPENLECVEEDSAFIFASGNIQDLSEKMEKALDKKDHMFMTENAYDLAKQRFNIEIVASQYEELYNKLLSD